MPMAASVDADLFETTEEAIDFVGRCGGGVVRVTPAANLKAWYWQSLVEAAKKRDVKIEHGPKENDDG